MQKLLQSLTTLFTIIKIDMQQFQLRLLTLFVLKKIILKKKQQRTFTNHEAAQTQEADEQ